MSTPQPEPIFARQEQAVVYFFSRYWQQIEPFCRKRLYDIQTRFPDASMEDPSSGDWEAIEFEYALSSFYGHLNARKSFKAAIKALNDDANDGDAPYDSLYIVYWEEDTDKDELRQEIKARLRKKCPRLKKIEFVDLRKKFSPCIKPESDRLGAYWEFRQDDCVAEVYPREEIEAETRALAKDKVIQLLEVNDGRRGTDRTYRIAGFNTRRSDFIECDHWKRIHFYTTGYFADESIPTRLFVRPTGTGRYSGCFEVRLAFRILQFKDSRLADYFRKFYFYPYDWYEQERLQEMTCLVYSGFTGLDVDQGVKLYDYLDRAGYAQRMASELIDDSSEITRIDAIVG
jgi:hypothetical protein